MTELVDGHVAIRAFTPDEEDRLVALWEDCGLTRPWNDPRKDIARKLADSPWRRRTGGGGSGPP